MIITKQIIRDKLFFNGPLTLTELVEVLGVDNEHRSNVLVLLNKLQDNKQAQLDIEQGLWSTSVVVE
jgi:DNA-binding transcriptional regulator GbsR (MarR family)